jgi:hypothetical protein
MVWVLLSTLLWKRNGSKGREKKPMRSGQFGPRQAHNQERQKLSKKYIAKTWPRTSRKGPNCPSSWLCPLRLCSGSAREITVAGIIMAAIIPVINTPLMWEVKVCPAPLGS